MNATERVIALLADRLCEAGVLPWPGTDGLTLEEVVLAAYRSGAVPSPLELAALHPDLADDIRRFFADVAADVSRSAELRAPAPAPPAVRG